MDLKRKTIKFYDAIVEKSFNEWIEEVIPAGFRWIKELPFDLETFMCNLFQRVQFRFNGSVQCQMQLPL